MTDTYPIASHRPSVRAGGRPEPDTDRSMPSTSYQDHAGPSHYGHLRREEDQNGHLLQQAASYASLATPSLLQHSKGRDGYEASFSAPSTGDHTASHPSERIRTKIDTLQRLPYRAGYFDEEKYVADRKMSSFRNDGNEDPSAWDAAPRLSMSSCDSSGGSEVKTPESTGTQPAWRVASTTDVTQSDERASPPPPSIGLASSGLRDISDAFRHPDGFAAVGFEHAERDSRSPVDGDQRQTAQEMGHGLTDQLQAHEPYRSAASPQDKLPGRSVTIKAKRPDTLSKLPTQSYQTDRTVTPSSPERSNKNESSLVSGETASGSGDLLEPDRSGRISSRAGPSSHAGATVARTGESDSSANSFRFPSLSSSLGPDSVSDLKQPAYAQSGPPKSPIPRTATSPDSWRSLLPEHDPYFVPPLENGTSKTSSRTGSDALSSSISATAASIKDLNLDRLQDATRRWSNESQRSSFSLPGPVAAHASGSYSASSSLYDLDGTFDSNGSRAAFAPLQYNYNQSSRSLASPTPSTGAFSDAGRLSMTGKLAESIMDQQRRHASFSTFDHRNAQSRSNFQHAPFVHPDYLLSAHSMRASPPLYVSPQASASTSSGARILLGSSKSDVIMSATVPNPFGHEASTAKSVASDDGRDQWPSSRNSLQSMASPQSSSQPIFTDERLRQATKALASLDANSEATDAPSSSLPGKVGLLTASRIQSPPSVISTCTSENVTEDAAGAITTTCTTTTTTTTTTFVHRPLVPSLSEVGNGELPRSNFRASASLDSTQLARSASLQPFASPKSSAYEVSPLSPPSLPFLDSRPAPSSTDFSIETQSGSYTLKTKLPGFSLDGITLATKHHCQLVIVADKWDESEGGHFERRITFGPDADLKATRASFDGTLLKITVPRRR